MAIIYGGNSFSSDYDFDKNEYKSYTETATKWTPQAKVVTDGGYKVETTEKQGYMCKVFVKGEWKNAIISST